MKKSIIKLKNVSKFYYNKGVIASGFSKVNLEFKIGEFVAITGESGSGKSTLLNVISGLDTYEEGEMYINGEETSHFSEKDFEDYRRKYIGNIFQSFNLVNSYTVYQNIELVLLLNGNKKKNIKSKVLDLIKKVDLYKFRNTKVSKLSGGQKQRVAIARALAKDTPIIIADEPTGNLDSKAAKGIVKLLSEISKDKLVIIVTHNYDQVEEFVTRKIKMHDGKVLEDQVIKEITNEITPEVSNYKNIRSLSKLLLGIRNTYNIIPKFLLILAVYLFITTALMSEYAAFKKEEYLRSKEGYNYIFENVNDDRIIIKKNDKTPFSEQDYEEISKIGNVKNIIKNDLLLDTNLDLSGSNLWLYGTVNDLANFTGKLDKGHLPANADEIIIVGSKNDYYLGEMPDELLEKYLNVENFGSGSINDSLKLKVVGIKYTERTGYSPNQFYVSNEISKKLTYQINQQYSKAKVLFQDKYYDSNYYDNNFKIIPNNRVPEGKAYIPDSITYLCKKEYCLYQPLSIEVENLYYNDTLNLTVLKTYTKKNIKSLLDINDFESNEGAIFINPNDYNNLYNKENYQSSIFIEDINLIDETVNKLNSQGITTLKLKDTLVDNGDSKIMQIIQTVVTIVLIFVLFFISYFVIRVILKSRNVYFTTLRMLGATKKISKELLIIQLINVANLAYLIFIGVIALNHYEILKIKFITTTISYLALKDYIILYLILIMMSYLISTKYAKKLFKNSTMKTLREEV